MTTSRIPGKRKHSGLTRKISLSALSACMLFGLTVLPCPSPAQADETEVVMKLLLKKGIITKAEYDEVMSELKQDATSLEKKVKQHGEKIAMLTKKQERLVGEDKPFILNKNLSLGGNLSFVGQGSSGNDDNTAISGEGDATDASYAAELELSIKTGEKGEAYMLIEGGEGNGLEGEEIVSFWGVNGDAKDSSSRLEISEAWYQHPFMDDKLHFTIGKLDLTNYFDGNTVANDETSQFLSGGFVNSIAVEFPDNSGGARLTASPSDLIDVSLAWQSGDSDWEDIFDNAFYIGEVDVKPVLQGKQGNYRFYGWTNQVDHAELIGSNTDESGWGAGVSLDQQLTDALTFFARVGYQDEDVYSFDVAWSAGFSVAGSLWGRENDILGLAYGMAMLSDDYETNLRNSGISPEDESHFEAYYSIFVNQHLAISPDLQIVTNAEGNNDFNTVWVGSLRGLVTF